MSGGEPPPILAAQDGAPPPLGDRGETPVDGAATGRSSSRTRRETSACMATGGALTVGSTLQVSSDRWKDGSPDTSVRCCVVYVRQIRNPYAPDTEDVTTDFLLMQIADASQLFSSRLKWQQYAGFLDNLPVVEINKLFSGRQPDIGAAARPAGEVQRLLSLLHATFHVGRTDVQRLLRPDVDSPPPTYLCLESKERRKSLKYEAAWPRTGRIFHPTRHVRRWECDGQRADTVCPLSLLKGCRKRGELIGPKLGFIRARLSIALVRATSLCSEALRSSSKRRHNMVDFSTEEDATSPH